MRSHTNTFVCVRRNGYNIQLNESYEFNHSHCPAFHQMQKNSSVCVRPCLLWRWLWLWLCACSKPWPDTHNTQTHTTRFIACRNDCRSSTQIYFTAAENLSKTTRSSIISKKNVVFDGGARHRGKRPAPTQVAPATTQNNSESTYTTFWGRHQHGSKCNGSGMAQRSPPHIWRQIKKKRKKAKNE